MQHHIFVFIQQALAKMLHHQVFERFVEESPVSVMVRGLLETILCPQKLDELFEKNTKTQYTKELLFSTVVEMMSTVACGIRPSIHAAYQAKASEINVSVTSNTARIRKGLVKAS